MDVPDSLLVHIVQYLTGDERCRIQRVCKRFRALPLPGHLNSRIIVHEEEAIVVLMQFIGIIYCYVPGKCGWYTDDAYKYNLFEKKRAILYEGQFDSNLFFWYSECRYVRVMDENFKCSIDCLSYEEQELLTKLVKEWTGLNICDRY